MFHVDKRILNFKFCINLIVHLILPLSHTILLQADSNQSHHTINLTPLSYIPGARIEKYLGNLNFFLIRETSSLREVGGISGFVNSFICESYSIVRSHVNALGGNAVVSYFMSEFVLMHSVHKNQVTILFL